MNDKVGGVGKPEGQQVPSLEESKKAKHIPSIEKKLEEGMNIFSKFIWIITFSWVKAYFANRKEKQKLCNELSKNIPRKGDSVTTKKSIYKQLSLLSLEQLKKLDKEFKNETIKEQFRNLNLTDAKAIHDKFISLLQPKKEVKPKEEIQEKSVEDLITEIKKDMIYDVEGRLSLFPWKPTLHERMGYLPPRSLERAKTILTQGKIQETFKIHCFAGWLGGTKEVSFGTTSNEVQENGTKYLSVTFSSNQINYHTCKFAFREGEKREDLVKRIANDGSLEKELLHLQAKYTKEAIPE